MAFVKVSKSLKNEMLRSAGYRERSIIKNSSCVTDGYGRKDVIVFHDKKSGDTCAYMKNRGWVN